MALHSKHVTANTSAKRGRPKNFKKRIAAVIVAIWLASKYRGQRGAGEGGRDVPTWPVSYAANYRGHYDSLRPVRLKPVFTHAHTHTPHTNLRSQQLVLF